MIPYQFISRPPICIPIALELSWHQWLTISITYLLGPGPHSKFSWSWFIFLIFIHSTDTLSPIPCQYTEPGPPWHYPITLCSFSFAQGPTISSKKDKRKQTHDTCYLCVSTQSSIDHRTFQATPTLPCEYGLKCLHCLSITLRLLSIAFPKHTDYFIFCLYF